jgi:hypothetical protein
MFAMRAIIGLMMKKFLHCIMLTALLPLSANAVPSWKEVIQQYRDMFARSASERKPVVYPELAGRIEGLFQRYPITHIVINGLSDKGKAITTDLYISEKEVCIIQADEGWNLYADANHIFEWEKGKSEGIRTPRDNQSLVSYLYYLTDVSWIMAGFYSAYLSDPTIFTRVSHDHEKWVELRLKTPRDGFEAIYVSEKPLWFYGLRCRDAKSGRVSEFKISEPELVKKIPAKIIEQFKAIHFEDSTLSLNRHMSFL